MSKHKPALPERLYYRLADAAQLLGCSTDNLLHYGACGHVELLASGRGAWVNRWRSKAVKTGTHATDDSDYDQSSFDFFAVTVEVCRMLEQRGACVAPITWRLYRIENIKGVSRLDAINGRGDDSDQHLYLFGFFSLTNSRHEPTQDDPYGNDLPRIAVADLWVRAEELHRFRKEGSSHVQSDPPMPEIQEKPIGITERNKTLAIIAALADKCGIDVSARGSAAKIARITEAFGTAVSDDAVMDRVKAIPEALESFKK